MKKIAEGFDFFFNKMIPKKFLVVVIATVIMLKKIQAPTEYWYILIAYMGVNAVAKVPAMVKTLRDGK